MLESVHAQEKEFSGKYVIMSSKTSRIKSDLKVFSQFSQVWSKAKQILGCRNYYNAYARGYNKDKRSSNDKSLIFINGRIKAISDKNIHPDFGNGVDIYPGRSTFANHYLSSVPNNISLKENKERELIGDGLPAKEIVIKLHISDPTEISHRKKLI